MTDTAEIADLVRSENARLVAVLDGLDATGWETPSLCPGWTVRDVVVHLLMAYRLSVPRFLVGMALNRFDFDRFAHRWATRDARTPVQARDDLAATATERFGVPGAPPEAPLSHLVIHTQDVVRPLGVSLAPDPRVAPFVLGQLTGPRFTMTPDEVRAGLTWTATDVDWATGEGPEVRGDLTALITVLGGRPTGLDELSGPGADAARRRLAVSAAAR